MVVVDKIDRFYRHLKGLLIALDTLRERDVTFVSVQEKIDLSTPWGKLTLTVLGMLAEIYIDNLRYETHKGLLARARKGLCNGSIPLGYCDGLCSACTDANGADYCPQYGGADRGDGRKLVIHPVEGEAVRRMFAWYLTGEYSDGEIAERLNADGVDLPDGRRIGFRTKGRAPARPPTVFSKDSVRELLQHEVYSGVVAFYGVDEKGRKRKRKNPLEVFPGEHPALVSPADFARAQELRQMFAHRVRLGRTQPCMYPLSGLLLCDTCGRNMRGMTSGGRRYYRDVTHVNHIGNCVQKTVRADDGGTAGRGPALWREAAGRLAGVGDEQPLHAAGAGDTGGIRAGAAGAAGSGDRVVSGRRDHARRSTRPRSGSIRRTGVRFKVLHERCHSETPRASVK